VIVILAIIPLLWIDTHTLLFSLLPCAVFLFFLFSCYASGCVLYELCTLKHAFDAHNLLGLVWKIVSESHPPIPDHYSSDLHELVAAMLAKDPAQRPSIDAILEKGFIRARLHSQIKAKMSLKTKKTETTANTNAATTNTSSAASATVSPTIGRQSSRPISGSSTNAASSSLPQSIQPTSSRSNSTSTAGNIPPPQSSPAPSPSPPISSPTAAIASLSLANASNNSTNGTNSSRTSTRTVDVGSINDMQRGSPPAVSPNPISTVPPRALSAQIRGPAANIAPLHTIISGTVRDYSSNGPLLSPTEQMAQRKKDQADQRALELRQAALGTADRNYAQQRTVAEFRGGGGSMPRPTSSQPYQPHHQQQVPSYQMHFDEEANAAAAAGVAAPPARQRSAGTSRSGQRTDQIDSGRGNGPSVNVANTPTRYNNPPHEWNTGGGGVSMQAYPASPIQTGTTVTLDERPIKSSGSYRLGGGGVAPILSPAAAQASRQLSGANSPASNTSGSRTSQDGTDDYSSSSSLPMRPNSVSSSSRVGRVTRGEDDPDEYSSRMATARHPNVGTGLPLSRGYSSRGGGGGSGMHHEDDSYSNDEFDAADSSDDEILGAYNIARSPAAAASPSAYTSERAVRPLSSTNTTSSESASSSAFALAAAASAATAAAPPPMSSKQEALKQKCLQSMSLREFEEVCDFIRTRSAANDSNGSGLNKEELAKRFGVNNQDVVFQVEQYVFLSDLLAHNAAAASSSASSAPKTSRTASTTSTTTQRATSATKSSSSLIGNKTPVVTPTKSIKPNSAGTAANSSSFSSTGNIPKSSTVTSTSGNKSSTSVGSNVRPPGTASGVRTASGRK
jgi:hypothetical protein